MSEAGANSKALALFQQANDLVTAGDYAGAEPLFRAVLELNPLFPQAHANLGYLLDHRGAVAQAEVALRTAISMAPQLAGVRLNLGALLLQQKRLEEAEAVYAAALQIEPESSPLWSNLGSLYVAMQRYEDAETCFVKAIQLDPANRKAPFNLAYLRLRAERFKEGWELFETRDWYATMEQHFQFPRWRGEPLNGQSLMLSFEAGHGDVIQFCRYATLLKGRGAGRIGLVCHPALTRLLQSLPALDTVISFTDNVPREGFDYWLPLMSAPHYCHVADADFSVYAEVPYLYPDADLQARWASRLPQGPLRVGLVWKGNPAFENDRDRSLPSLSTLQPLLSLPNIHWVSLQKGRGEDEALAASKAFALTPLGGDMQDFADAAAILSQLDLLISVDTAMAHLAGAIGTPCWLLLPDYMTDWRWGTERSDSVWYPGNMRLFRQDNEQTWEPVIETLRHALAQWNT